MSSYKAQDEVDFLEREISRVDNLMSPLKRERIMVLRKLNSMRALTRHLPMETLSLVFQYAVPLSQYRVLALGRVSSHWREVAWSTPQLWTSLHLCVSSTTTDWASIILELYLKNVGELPFDLRLHGSDGRKDRIEGPFCAILFNPDYSRKIRNLELRSPPLRWLRSISQSFSRVECISLESPYSTSLNENISLSTLPRLRSVRLNCVMLNISLPWTSITILRLETVPMSASAKMLIQCLNLVSFEALKHVWTPQPIGSYFADNITLRYLEDFSWSFDHNPWCLATLQHIRLPALCHLHWDQRYAVADFEPSVLAILSNPTIRTLRLNRVSAWNPTFIQRVFSQIDLVQAITLEDCPEACVYEFFRALCPTGNTSGTTYLPFLASLNIRRCFEDLSSRRVVDIFNMEFSHTILEVCKGRFTGPGSSFSISFDEHRVDWVPAVREELYAMVRNGFNLDILEGGGKVLCMP